LRAESHLEIIWDFFGVANREYWPSKDLEFVQICAQVLLAVFTSHSSAHRPSLQLSLGGKEDVVVFCILVEVDWHLV
jgi:hypothetical protein